MSFPPDLHPVARRILVSFELHDVAASRRCGRSLGDLREVARETPSVRHGVV